MKSDEPTNDVQQLLEKFVQLPNSFKWKVIVFSITNPEWTPLRNEAICTALGLEIGATLAATVRISPQVPPITLYAHKEIADRILNLPKAAGMRVKAQTIFGVAKYPHFSDEGTIIEKNQQSGLLIIDILSGQALGSRA